MKIEDIDKNFKATTVNNREVVFFDVVKKPFSLEGFPWGDPAKGQFYRLPPSLRTPSEVNWGCLWTGQNNTTGGCVRFRTDANVIALRSKLHCPGDLSHMPRSGSSGFDLYVGGGTDFRHVGTVQPLSGQINLESVVFSNDEWPREMREWRINLPLYGGMEWLEIGLPSWASLEEAPAHAVKPILFYGSSITQGGCASRPGNCYSSWLCRAVDAEQINLGFSGCGKGEPDVARVIGSLDLSAFVMDYDHNAPTYEHLLNTHETFYKIVREARPSLPIIMMSKCDIWRDRNYAATAARRDLIKANYERGIAAGDKHLYFIDGEELFGTVDREACAVDCCHPNDLGFYRMYERVLPVLRQALEEA